MYQNASNEVLLAWFKFQAKIPSRSGVCVKREWQKYTTPSPALSKDEKDERLRGIGHNISMGNLVMGFYSVTVTWFIKTVCYKMRQILLQNVTANLLQNVTEVYYEMWVLLQNATVVTGCDDFITKCDVYYKLRQCIHQNLFSTNHLRYWNHVSC